MSIKKLSSKQKKQLEKIANEAVADVNEADFNDGQDFANAVFDKILQNLEIDIPELDDLK